jgi:hypothetical protein
VANRKFAFTCPKCGTENIFDNRMQDEKPAQMICSLMKGERNMSSENPQLKRVHSNRTLEVKRLSLMNLHLKKNPARVLILK